ncbi:MAG: hypothetical protein Q7S44_01395 [bacterium]|nr:hypothetical protein [bacterium]
MGVIGILVGVGVETFAGVNVGVKVGLDIGFTGKEGIIGTGGIVGILGSGMACENFSPSHMECGNSNLDKTPNIKGVDNSMETKMAGSMGKAEG